jgi:D-alanyl-D-alanine carboxypeptidase
MSRRYGSLRSRRLATVAGFAAAAVLSTSVSSNQAAVGAGAPSGSSPKQSRLAKALDALVDRPDGPPGAVVIVHRGDHRRVLTAGVANVKTGREIHVNDHMRVASVAKAFSGAVALRMVDRGRLSLRDTIDEVLPYLPDAWGDVTLAQLLHHTSGIPEYLGDEEFQERLTSKPLVPIRPRRLLGFIKDEDLVFEPGSQYAYSNSDNVAVGLMVQQVTGRPYARALHRLVAKPLHLERTTLPDGAEIRRPYIHGYGVAPGQPPEDESEVFAASYAYASGGVVSTPADLNRFIRGYIGARLFDRAIQAKQLRLVAGTSEPPGPGRNKAGLAVFRYQTRCGTMYGHTGNTLGYTQFAAATLNGRRSVTVSITRQVNHQVDTDLFSALRRLERLAVCAALKHS